MIGGFGIMLVQPIETVQDYRYYKFQPTLVRNERSKIVQLSELDIRLYSIRVDYSAAIASNPGGFDNLAVNQATVPANAIDNNVSTKFFDQASAPLIIDFGRRTRMSEYTFATGNNDIRRDPISWTFSGSMDNSNWVLLDAQTKFPTTVERNIYLPYFGVSYTIAPTRPTVSPTQWQTAPTEVSGIL